MSGAAAAAAYAAQQQQQQSFEVISDLPLTHPHHHAHTQSNADWSAAAPRRVGGADRNHSMDLSSHGILKKTRSNIIAAPSGGLTPLSGSPRNQPIERTRTFTEGADSSSSSLSLNLNPNQLNSPTGNGSNSDRKGAINNNSPSFKSLSPLPMRPSMMIGTKTNTPSRPGDPATPAAPLATSAHLSIHSSSHNLSPSTAPTFVTTVPHASGIMVALHVSGSTFLTTPETLMRVAQLEGKPNNGETSILQWIGEDAIIKHREQMAESQAQAVKARKPTATEGSAAAEPSPRGNQPFPSPPTLALSGPATSSHLPSTVHHREEIEFHAPTYSFFLDRNPTSFPLILDYLRDGAGCMRDRLKHVDDNTLFSLSVEADHFLLSVLSVLVQSEVTRRAQKKFLDPDDLFWSDLINRLDVMFPVDSIPGSLTPREVDNDAPPSMGVGVDEEWLGKRTVRLDRLNREGRGVEWTRKQGECTRWEMTGRTVILPLYRPTPIG